MIPNLGVAPQTTRLRGAVLCDFLEERWPSMNLVADMLLEHAGEAAGGSTLHRIRPSFTSRACRLPLVGNQKVTWNIDRFLNRMYDYPRHLRSLPGRFDFFHVCDHSYAHLIHGLPPDRTGVHCHDLDAFRCLVEPKAEPRPRWFRLMAERILTGMQRARWVFYSTDTLKREIELHGLVAKERLLKAPYGVSPVFCPAQLDDRPNVSCNLAIRGPFLLHVGSCIPRKRVDVLLEIMARLAPLHPDLKLVKVGGEWTPEQQAMIGRGKIAPRIVHLREFQSTEALADLYRRASLVLIPSSSEGFGLPLIEALATGARVVATDLPIFRETAADAALYCPLGEYDLWAATVHACLLDSSHGPPAPLRLSVARQYSWKRYAAQIIGAYEGLVRGE